jgi:SAM-dependent methyltransferase
MDICDMKDIQDNQLDLVICSHVLEHVPDPDKALREIFRILRPGGKAILMVPLFWDVKDTIEDKAHDTDELRLKYYGQDDHVRLFSRIDFLNRLDTAGFSVAQLRPPDFDQKKIKENAIASNSILYICQKTEVMTD